MTDVTANSGQVPLEAPLRGATFGQAFARFFKKYAIFHGRASRSEFWWWFLAHWVISGRCRPYRSKRLPAGLGGCTRNTSRMIQPTSGIQPMNHHPPDRFVSCRRRQLSASHGMNVPTAVFSAILIPYYIWSLGTFIPWLQM